jgi:ParB/RepB/Spo0J family partition protein
MAVAQNRVVVELPLREIFADPEFNCRGEINALDCVPLANDIKRDGLQTPISVQPWEGAPPYKYRVLAGHNRIKAFEINQESAIPCFIIHGLDDLQARDYNLKENLFRTNLNLLQESRALRPYFERKLTDKAIAERLNRSVAWVTPRRQLLDLPADIQDAAATDVINQTHVKSLHALRINKEKMYEVFRGIKEARERGERVVNVKKDKDIVDMTKLKRPAAHELAVILDVFTPNLVHNTGQENFGCKCLAFAYGMLSEAELWLAYRNECTRLGLPFNPPAEVRAILGV